MKRIVAIAWKDTVLRFSSLAEWLFFLLLPIVFTVVLAGGTGAPSDARIRLLVVDEAKSPLSAELIRVLEGSEAVRPEVTALANAEDEFGARRVSSVLFIASDLNLARLELGTMELELRQQPNNVNAIVAQQAVQAAILRVGSTVDIARSSLAEAERVRPFASETARGAYFDAALEQAQKELGDAPERVTIAKGATPDQIEYDPRANSSAGQLITWTFIPLLGISAMFAYERQKGTLRRLLISPTSRATYLLGTIVGQVATALVQMLLLVGFGVAVMHLNWGQSPAALAVMLVSATLAGAALGSTLGTLVKTEGQANGLSVTLGQVMALLGGCWYPLELFPQAVRTAVKVLPTTWAMQGLLDIVLRAQGVKDVLPEAGVLLGFALVFFVVGVWRFRYE
jgi:ABC-2 type transport system permease protein